MMFMQRIENQPKQVLEVLLLVLLCLLQFHMGSSHHRMVSTILPEQAERHQALQEVKAQNARLEREIDALRSPSRIEDRAREKLSWVRDGEVYYRYVSLADRRLVQRSRS